MMRNRRHYIARRQTKTTKVWESTLVRNIRLCLNREECAQGICFLEWNAGRVNEYQSLQRAYGLLPCFLHLPGVVL